jgi:hypothetical protein
VNNICDAVRLARDDSRGAIMAVNPEVEMQIVQDLIARLEKGEAPITNRKYIKGVAERGLRDELALIRGAAQDGTEVGEEMLCDECLAVVLHEVVDEFFEKEPTPDTAPAIN